MHEPRTVTSPWIKWYRVVQGTLNYYLFNYCRDRGRVAIYRPFGEVSLSLNRTVTCMVLKANDRRTSCPCHDEFRGPRSDYVRQSEANPQVYVETPLHPEKLTVWCALWAGGILLQKR
ncbi:uncharacterized protein TNCV_3352001 [Trichonephila clavipes]|nr:uncharacterized protein TNCV_3352001 [Trichonephila clavipes]